MELQPKGHRLIRKAEAGVFNSLVPGMVEGAARTLREELRGVSVGGWEVLASRFCFSRRKNFFTGRVLVVQRGREV